MYRLIKNMLNGRKKVKDEFYTSHTYRRLVNYHIGTGEPYYYHTYCPTGGGYHHSLSLFLERLERNKDSTKVLTWRETTGWEPRIKFSWDKPQFFPPQEAANYVKGRHLLDDIWLYFESRWQIYSGRGEEQHYFDIDIYHTTYPMGSKEIGRLKKRIAIDCLLRY